MPDTYVLVAQWIERLVAVQKAGGSIPPKDTILKFPADRQEFLLIIQKTTKKQPESCFLLFIETLVS